MRGEGARVIPRKRRWAAVTVLLSACACAHGSALSLRLDRSLSPITRGPADARTEMLVRFGMGELRHRIARVRGRAEAVREGNRLLSQRIVEHDALALQLRDLSVSQGRVLEGLRAVLGARVEARAQAPGSAPQTPAPRPAPIPERRPAPLPAPVPGLVVAGIPHWVLQVGLGGAVLALLAWIALLLRGRRNGAVAAAQRAEDDDVTAWIEHAATMSAPPGEAEPPDAVARTQHSDREASGPSAEGPDVVDLAVVDARPVRSATEAASPSNAGTGGGASDPAEQRSHDVTEGHSAHSYALKEVDTLIAFEQYDAAKTALEEMLASDPDNPELLLRHYHVRTRGGAETITDDEELLRAMMEGPLSDTMTRVREIGRGMMPGDPLFRDQGQRDAAVKVLGAGKGGEGPAPGGGAPTRSEVQDDEGSETTPRRGASPLRVVGRDAGKT